MEKRVHLKGRLLALSNCVENSDLVADIGCDHGRLCVSLLQTGRAKSAIAGDISTPSIKKAETLRDKCGLQDKMQIIVADGLQGINKQPDTIIIAGMGGQLIADILAKGEQIAQKADRIIMQPMRGISELRSFLHENCYHITSDCFCKEGGRIYQLIVAHHENAAQDISLLPKGFYEIGALMIQEKDPLLSEYLQKLKAEYSANVENARKYNIVLSECETILKNIYLTESIMERRFNND